MKNANPTRAVMLGCVLLVGASGVVAQDWPQWRGPNRDDKVIGFTPPKTWPKELTQKWKVPVGLGESSPVLVGDKIYVFGRQGGDEVTLCLNAATGKEVWKDSYTAPPVTGAAKAHPGTRSTPAVGEGKICTLGAAGKLSCLDAVTGKEVWRKETKAPKFFTSSSPLILDGMCIVYGTALTAYDLATGESKWQWGKDGTPYGSPVLMTVDGIKQIVTPTSGALVGVGLADGKQLWEVKLSADYNDTNGTPIVDGQTVIFSGPTSGLVAVKIEKEGAGFAAKQLWKKKEASNRFNTPVLRDGQIYLMNKSQYITCVNEQTGDTAWSDTKKRGDCGCILNAGSVLVALSNDAQLVVLEPSAKEYKEIASYKVSDKTGLEGPWTYPILAGNRVFVKDRESLTLWTVD